MLSGISVIEQDIKQQLKHNQYEQALNLISNFVQTNAGQQHPLLAYYALFCLFKLERYYQLERQYQALMQADTLHPTLLTQEQKSMASYMRAFGFVEQQQYESAQECLRSIQPQGTKVYVRAQLFRANLYLKSEEYDQALTCLALSAEDYQHDIEEFLLIKGIALAKLHKNMSDLVLFYQIFSHKNREQIKASPNLLLKLNGVLILADLAIQEKNFILAQSALKLLKEQIPSLSEPEKITQFNLDILFLYALSCHGQKGPGFDALFNQYFQKYQVCKAEAPLIARERFSQYAQLLLIKIYRSLESNLLASAQECLSTPEWENQDLLPTALQSEYLIAKFVYAIKAGNPSQYQQAVQNLVQKHRNDGQNAFYLLLTSARPWLAMIPSEHLAANSLVNQLNHYLSNLSLPQVTEPASLPFTPSYTMAVTHSGHALNPSANAGFSPSPSPQQDHPDPSIFKRTT